MSELKDNGKSFEPVRKHRWDADKLLVEAGKTVFIAGDPASVRSCASGLFARAKVLVTIRAGSQNGVRGCMIRRRDVAASSESTAQNISAVAPIAPPDTDDGL